jgi:hypothetical protein
MRPGFIGENVAYLMTVLAATLANYRKASKSKTRCRRDLSALSGINAHEGCTRITIHTDRIMHPPLCDIIRTPSLRVRIVIGVKDASRTGRRPLLTPTAVLPRQRADAFGPLTLSEARWRRAVSRKGKGPDE